MNSFFPPFQPAAAALLLLLIPLLPAQAIAEATNTVPDRLPIAQSAPDQRAEAYRLSQQRFQQYKRLF